MRSRLRRKPAGSPRGGLAKAFANVGLGAWFLVTAASQHPHRAFDRFRRYDPLGLLVPNWRFFAPEPSKHDFHVLHRVLEHDGVPTRWRETTRIASRKASHAVWFPDRRRDKGMFDLANELSSLMPVAGLDLSRTAPFELIRDFVAVEVERDYVDKPEPEGFQFLICRHTGHETEHDPEYLLASPFIPYDDVQAAASVSPDRREPVA